MRVLAVAFTLLVGCSDLAVYAPAADVAAPDASRAEDAAPPDAPAPDALPECAPGWGRCADGPCHAGGTADTACGYCDVACAPGRQCFDPGGGFLLACCAPQPSGTFCASGPCAPGQRCADDLREAWCCDG